MKKEGWLDKLKGFFADFADKFLDKFSEMVSSKGNSKKILIIDEIDVLFNRDYYGDTFNLAASLEHQSIRELLKFIWNNRSNNQLSHKFITKSSEFKEVIKHYSSLDKILSNQVHGMLAALETYEEEKYYIVNGRIMYKSQDTLSDKISYGYPTVFCYLKEFDSGKVNKSALDENLTISLCIS